MSMFSLWTKPRQNVVLTASKRRLSDSSMSRVTPRLPRLPIPPLRDTLDKYLKSIEPFLWEDQERRGIPFDEALESRVRWAEQFEKGLGSKLQDRLIELDKRSPYNWLDDNFWLRNAYHEWRAPLLINSNWWLAFQNDRSVPDDVLQNFETPPGAGISAWQVRRASWLLQRILQFKQLVGSQELHPNTTRTGLWICETTSKMFNTCRIPQRDCDRLIVPSPDSTHSRKILVMVHDWMYLVDVCDHGGEYTDHLKIEKRLRGVVADVERRLGAGERATPVGVLSADERNRWFDNREYLLSLSHLNHNTATAVEDCILTLSLDAYTLQEAPIPPYSRQPSELESHLHNIRSGRNARNRWFDKPITLIVESNTRAGMMGEHSPCDALVPSIVADYALVQDIIVDEAPSPLASSAPDSQSTFDDHDGWRRLDWVVDDHIKQQCMAAEDRAKDVITDSDNNVYWFTDYGADWIKGVAKLSPDAYIQMAMQLAWHMSHGTCTATYETALTRLFLHGRTETIRTLTNDSQSFVKTMITGTSDEKVVSLRRAVQTHCRLTREAATGKGIDRHLLGLRLVMEPDETSLFFEDIAFSRSQEWHLSTSGLTAGTYFRGTGFGASYIDGYGINYLSGSDIIKFGIESKFSCLLTSTDVFKENLFESLQVMRCAIESISDATLINNMSMFRL